jgi:iron complex transport system substrate-binding protein
MRRSLATAAAVAAAALLLSACGSSEPAKGSAGATARKITLTDASGAKVTLDRPATKVVGTEWNVVESLVSLGVDPVGVADPKGYTTWDKAAPLTNSPKDIGTRGEPSMDTLAGLTPDLIVTTTDLSASAVKQMKKIAPVLRLRSANAADQVGQMMDNVDTIARATGTEAAARKIHKEYEAKVAAGRKALAAAGRDGGEIAFADGYAAANQVTVRAYTSGSLIGAVNEDLGLKNAWTQKGDKDYGLASTDVEGLTGLGRKTQFAYIGNKDDKSSNVFTGELASNSVWTSLPFVEAGAVHRLDDGIWMFGGPRSMEQYIDAVVTSLTK